MDPSGTGEKDLFRAIFESAPDCVLVVGPDGRVQLANEQAVLLFGYSRDEVVGQPVEMLIPERFHHTHQSHRSNYLDSPRLRQMGAGLDLFGRRKDGSEFPVDIMLSPLRAGTSEAVLAIVRDVTERKHQEQKVQQTTAMFERLFEHAPDAIVVVNRHGDIVRTNAQAEAVFQYQREEMIGQPVATLLPERFRFIHDRHREGFHTNPKTRPMGAGISLSARRKDGSEFPVDIMLSPIEQEDEILVLAVVRDITERKQAEAREKMLLGLRQMEMLVREVHHRVKNNLQVVSSLLALQGMRAGDAEVADMFASTRSRVNTMALIHEKLYRSTYEGGTMLQFDEYLRDLLRDLAQSHSADQKGIEVRMEVEPISLHIDLAVPCGLVVNELVTNAFKHAFADRGGTLRLTLARQGPDVRLEVSDNGAGIPVLAAGAGGRRTLGTQLVQTLVSQLRGKYDARSEEGTTISVVFPARTPEA